VLETLYKQAIFIGNESAVESDSDPRLHSELLKQQGLKRMGKPMANGLANSPIDVWL
jgi:hypothetical protein